VARETPSADAAFLGPQRVKAALAALARAGVEHRDLVLLRERTAASGRGRWRGRPDGWLVRASLADRPNRLVVRPTVTGATWRVFDARRLLCQWTTHT
jgi:hypothetical protein